MKFTWQFVNKVPNDVMTRSRGIGPIIHVFVSRGPTETVDIFTKKRNNNAK